MINQAQGFEYIENYGLIGDCHGCALISNKGSIDWLTFDRFDSPPLFWSLLDDELGAYLKVSLPDDFEWKRYYRANTNILITEAKNSESLIRLTDYMPLGRSPGSKTHDYTCLTPLHGLVRKIEVIGKSLELKVAQRLSKWPISSKNIFVHEGSVEFKIIFENNFVIALQEGTPHYLVIAQEMFQNLSVPQLQSLEMVTEKYWREWIAYSQYQGVQKNLIDRSALALKLLIHAPTGAIMAAPTTSLPERIGGERNWDYRYSWIRDSSFTLYALGYLGYSGEADRYASFMRKAILNNPDGQLKVMYDLDGNSNIPEIIVPNIKGYMNSSPVRIGNGAHDQVQLDTYGEFLDWAYLHRELGGKIDQVFLNKIKMTAEYVVTQWKKPDQGIWEVRSEPEDFTYSKVMCWVTLDRAESLLNQKDCYQQQKEEIEKFISEKCIENGRLKRSAQNSSLDASLLLILAVGYPLDEKIYANTVEGIFHELGDGPFIRRYMAEDGLKEQEGHFLICSFWAINACLFLGQVKKAKLMFAELTKKFNELGLFSEEIDSESGHFLGNFPQALTHLAFIETASYFEIYSKEGKKGLKGCHGDRVRIMHKTLHGPKAVWDFVVHTGNVRKLFPSYASILKWK